MEGETTPDLYAIIKEVSERPMLQFDPAEYFERATLVFMQFSQMSMKINANHTLLQKLTKQLEDCQHLLRKISKKL